jgi:hypothetical protein
MRTNTNLSDNESPLAQFTGIKIIHYHQQIINANMKKAAILLFTSMLGLYSYSQQQGAATQPQKDNAEEKTTAFLSAIGGLSAAYILTAQDHIEVQIKIVDKNRSDSSVALQKLTIQKNISNLLLEQLVNLQTTNAIGTDSPDHSFIVELKVALNLIVKEIDLGVAYIRDNSSNKKTQFDTASAEAAKKIKELLGIE